MTRDGAIAHVAQAIRSGRLVRLDDGSTPCVDCGKPATVYDHRDYSKPLEVDPVCLGCNRKRGKANNDHPRDRRFVAVKISDDELHQMKVLATRCRASSVEVATIAIRYMLQNEELLRRLLP